jgi:hypothetical protein
MAINIDPESSNESDWFISGSTAADNDLSFETHPLSHHQDEEHLLPREQPGSSSMSHQPGIPPNPETSNSEIQGPINVANQHTISVAVEQIAAISRESLSHDGDLEQPVISTTSHNAVGQPSLDMSHSSSDDESSQSSMEVQCKY